MLTKKETSLNGAFLFFPDQFEDARGTFQEAYSRRKYAELGLEDEFVQSSFSVSSRGVMRGLHCDPEMSKLVQCVAGRVFDVIVDMRPESPTYRKWESFLLSDTNHKQLYVPKGFAHGFLALADGATVLYQQSAFYEPGREFTVFWADPRIGIKWPFLPTLVSDKDAAAVPTVAEVFYDMYGAS